MVYCHHQSVGYWQMSAMRRRIVLLIHGGSCFREKNQMARGRNGRTPSRATARSVMYPSPHWRSLLTPPLRPATMAAGRAAGHSDSGPIPASVVADSRRLRVSPLGQPASGSCKWSRQAISKSGSHTVLISSCGRRDHRVRVRSGRRPG
jgi:hypothetical protein